jgi:hypothetical protein
VGEWVGERSVRNGPLEKEGGLGFEKYGEQRRRQRGAQRRGGKLRVNAAAWAQAVAALWLLL